MINNVKGLAPVPYIVHSISPKPVIFVFLLFYYKLSYSLINLYFKREES